MKFKGDIIITDPCYIIPDDKNSDWEKCRYGDNMEVLGIKAYICRDTIYGDWSCKTFSGQMDEDGDVSPHIESKVIGEFCADAGMVAVFLLDEVLKYNPDFDYHINNKHTTTLIEDFDGDVDFLVIGDNVHVVGKGNKDFFTMQTGF